MGDSFSHTKTKVTQGKVFLLVCLGSWFEGTGHVPGQAWQKEVGHIVPTGRKQSDGCCYQKYNFLLVFSLRLQVMG